jgi:hypothetical protein
MVRFQYLCDALLSMANMHLDAELLVKMLCQMLSGIDTTVLSASTTETEHQGCEASLYVSAYMIVSQFVYAVKEGEDLTVVLKESDYGFIETGELLIRLVATRIMSTATVKYITSAIA